MLRREFIKSLAAGAAIGAFPSLARANAKARVVIVGGGYAGATAAKYLRLWGGRASRSFWSNARPVSFPARCPTWCWAAAAKSAT